jgi:hypothetical protein
MSDFFLDLYYPLGPRELATQLPIFAGQHG